MVPSAPTIHPSVELSICVDLSHAVVGLGTLLQPAACTLTMNEDVQSEPAKMNKTVFRKNVRLMLIPNLYRY
jgi:hypothetical protein